MRIAEDMGAADADFSSVFINEVDGNIFGCGVAGGDAVGGSDDPVGSNESSHASTSKEGIFLV